MSTKLHTFYAIVETDGTYGGWCSAHKYREQYMGKFTHKHAIPFLLQVNPQDLSGGNYRLVQAEAEQAFTQYKAKEG